MLDPNISALVVEVADGSMEKAQVLLAPLGAQKIVVQEIGETVASFLGDATWPEPATR